MSQNETIRTSATARVMLTFNFCNFDFSIGLENPNGVTQQDLEMAGNDCQLAANKAIDEYKKLAKMPAKDAIKAIRSQLNEVAKQIGENEEIKVDPQEVEKIAALPLYEPKKSKK
jgi:hypothetical protein